jgi:uncharacterized glyoxalase superfamily protein PhnB
MNKKVVPMIHVPDVAATVEWYQSIGFGVDDTYGNDGDGLSFAMLSFGSSQVMFNEGGSTSASRRREVDLYIYTDGVDQVYEQLKDKVEVIEGPHDTFYGMREFILRDLNRFWITFAEWSAFSKLMHAVKESDIDAVRNIVAQGTLKPRTLIAALAASNSSEIDSILKNVGAIAGEKIPPATLQLYAGRYRKDEFEINVTSEDGKLFAALGSQQPLRLMALNSNTFTPIAFDDFGTISFNVTDGKVSGCTLNESSHAIHLQRITAD